MFAQSKNIVSFYASKVNKSIIPLFYIMHKEHKTISAAQRWRISEQQAKSVDALKLLLILHTFAISAIQTKHFRDFVFWLRGCDRSWKKYSHYMAH